MGRGRANSCVRAVRCEGRVDTECARRILSLRSGALRRPQTSARKPRAPSPSRASRGFSGTPGRHRSRDVQVAPRPNVREAPSGVSKRKDLAMFRTIALGLGRALGAALPLASAAEAAVADGVVSSHSPADQIAPLEKAQFVYGGRNYCWYDAGWKGPGWYLVRIRLPHGPRLGRRLRMERLARRRLLRRRPLWLSLRLPLQLSLRVPL